MRHQHLIASYRRDFPWLIHCLASLKRFASGFLPPVVVVTSGDEAGARAIVAQSYPEAVVKVKDGPTDQGFLRAQIVMMQGDLFCPEADVVHLLGSDCFAFDAFTPEQYMYAGKPVMFTNTYEHLKAHAAGIEPWRRGVQQILGFRPEHEFMRRLPLLYPKELYAPFRDFVEKANRLPFEQAIYRSAPFKNCSESNLMGAWAWTCGKELYHWVDLDGDENFERAQRDFPSPVMQFWSHGGLDRPCDRSCVLADGSDTLGRTPRQIIDAVFSASTAKAA